MATYVMLTKLTDQGARTIKQDAAHILEVDEQLEKMGVKVLHQFAVLGRVDFVNIVEAADDMTVAKAALEMGSRGSIRVETLPAIPVAELIASLK